MKKYFISAALLFILAIPFVTRAQDSFGFGAKLDTVAAPYGPGNDVPLDERISSFIAIFLSFLGVIFLVLMLYAGYNWMTAAGDEEKINKAKATIRAALIGIIIVIASYAISVFVVSRLWGTAQSLLMPTTVYAQTTTVTPSSAPMLDRLKSVGSNAGYADATDGGLLKVVSTIINAFLGILGAIFVILMLFAGYSWMTAAGEEEKITKAKETIRAAVIGLIIIVGAFAIWNFIATYLIGTPA